MRLAGAFFKALRAQNLLEDRLIALLMEDADWSNRFATMKALGLSRFKVDERGAYTSEVLTLEDIRQETLADLKK